MPWNPPPGEITPTLDDLNQTHTHTHPEAHPKQPALEGRLIHLTNHGHWGRKGRSESSWPDAGHGSGCDKRLRAGGLSVPCRLRAEFPSRVPPARGEPAWEPPQWFPRQRRDPRQDSFLITEMAQVSITFGGGVNNKHERQQINETSRILSPAKCLFSSVFPRARGSPVKLEQRDFKFGKNLGNRSS